MMPSQGVNLGKKTHDIFIDYYGITTASKGNTTSQWWSLHECVWGPIQSYTATVLPIIV